jgi:hypothetical protein
MSVTDETGKSRRLSQVNNVSLPESEMKRREAVWELFHSEVVYLTAHLLVLKEVCLTIILYLKFKLSNKRTAFVPRDNVIFYGISLKFMISQCSVRYYNIPR